MAKHHHCILSQKISSFPFRKMEANISFLLFSCQNIYFTPVKQNTPFKLFSALWEGWELRKANHNNLIRV